MAFFFIELYRTKVFWSTEDLVNRNNADDNFVYFRFLKTLLYDLVSVSRTRNHVNKVVLIQIE